MWTKIIRSAVSLILVFISLVGYAQESNISPIYRQGNKLFDQGQYIKAMRFYKEALDINPNYYDAVYKMGESHRMTFDYESAVVFYEKVARNAAREYPLSTFRHGQMLKRTGEYNLAVQFFESFEELLKSQSLHEDDRYRAYYTQASVEKEGCLIALNELTNPKPDRGFKIMGDGINTPYMDYGAFAYGNDSLLSITSSRDGVKGKYIDYRFGESFSDIYRFQLEAGGWQKNTSKDNFQKRINSKWGEGSGSFNKDGSKFYYTNCDENLGDKCHIYYTVLEDGQWSEPISLNESINGDYNSRHPYISPSGDTLFFASDRPGGEGQYDLWMSLSAGGDNWSRPENLGPQVNTSFNELSPFYDGRQEALFFASDGHRGYGGYDIFVAKGLSFFDPEIFNPGFPFNSNRDEFFMYLGNTIGFVSSNRDGGLGKLDIYQFDVDPNESIITEILTDDFIAGANSLFSDDYDFDSENIEMINEIISNLLASNIADVNLALNSDLAGFYETLSQDDKDRIDRIIQARMRRLSETDLQALRIEDEFFYTSLTSEDKGHLDHLVMTYIEENDVAMTVSIPSEDQEFYEGLTTEDREKADQLIATRLGQANEFKYATDAYDSLSQEDQQQVDVLANDVIVQQKNIENLPLSPSEAMFLQNLDDQKRDQVYEAVKERILTIGDDDDFELSEEDRIFFQNLTSESHDALVSIAHSYIRSDVNDIEENLDREMVQVLDLYNSAQRESLNRILFKLINNVVKSDLYFAEANLTPEARVALQTFNKDDIVDFMNTHMNNLNVLSEIEIMERFLMTSGEQWKETGGIFFEEGQSNGIPSMAETADMVRQALIDQMGVDAETATVDNSALNEAPNGDVEEIQELEEGGYEEVRIAPTVTDQQLVTTLDQRDIDFYSDLSTEEKKTVDRSIAMEYLNATQDQPDLETRDEQYRQNLTPSEKIYLKLLIANLTPGEELSNAELSTLNEAFSFYSSLS
ncbi:MAG: tetratricopeptide repeat protein, partial [Bacteroidota bacterium]